jgi:hypothetical protein
MELHCHCPGCDQPVRTDVAATATSWSCPHCGRAQAVAAGAIVEGAPTRCCSCANPDLWRQKDFPQKLGILMVALGAITSSIAWGYHYPALALGILGAFALADMVLYWVMPDVLVCYRCGARHRVSGPGGEFGPYDHELGERYRQERLRMQQGAAG